MGDYKTVLSRIQHAMLIISVLNEELLSIAHKMPPEQANALIKQIEKSKASINQIKYDFDEQEDINRQQVNDPITIKKEGIDVKN